MNMPLRWIAGMMVAVLAQRAQAEARIGLDPYGRDEDISGTVVAVDIERDALGHFVYKYRVSAPARNLGSVLSLDVDLSCREVGDRGRLPTQRADGVIFRNASLNARHAPVNIDADFGAAGIFGIDVDNQAGWLLSLDPGQTVRGLRLISPNPPVRRGYVLLPFMGPSAPWDYSDVDPSDPDLPWVDDFTVFGVIEGAGCESSRQPLPEPARLDGTPLPVESDGLAIPAVQNDGGLDPRFRDEDISGTEVTVDIVEQSDGLYEYHYRVSAPGSNLGTVQSLSVDISCPEPLPRLDLPPQPTGEGFAASASQDGRHAAVNITGDFGSSFLFGITASNAASWGLGFEPGEARGGLRLVSPYPPTLRKYRLSPAMGPSAPWDYSDVDPSDETIPWVDDFTVAGVTEGPGCEPAPALLSESARFAGTPFPHELGGLNDLLSYSEPLRDRLHAELGEGSFALTIHYRDDIDPSSFEVTPASDGIRRLFNPQPGTSQTVYLPLAAGKNLFRLSAHTRFTLPDQDKGAGAGGREGASRDIDVFEVRVPSAE
jgi:hypothetical protein